MAPNASTELGPAADRRHLTIADVCAELGIARSTFYDWRAARKAPRCIKLPNGDIRIRRTDFDAWLRSLEDATA
jgi:predicted DNA-binding transcriptional regulator AlpA